jgi:hypothetical protein
MPKILERCVTRMMDNPDFKPQDGKTKSESAHAVCIANFQKTGMMKTGSTDLTEKGKAREAELMAAGSAILATVGNLTFDDVEGALRDALVQKFEELNPLGQQIGDMPYLEDVLYLDSQIIYHYQQKDWKAGFVINPDYTATIGEGTPVVQVWVEVSDQSGVNACGDSVWRSKDGKDVPALAPVMAAVWSTAFMNDLPDSSFLYIESGGTKDADGKTTPRSKRHFPYKDKSGTVDLAHLRNALSRIPQSSLPQAVKDRVMRQAQRIGRANGIDSGKTKAGADLSGESDGGDVGIHLLRFQIVSRAGRGPLTQVVISSDRGIAALMDGSTRVEMLFDTREPHKWTVADAKKYLSRPFICASASRPEVISEAAELPGPVADAMKKLKDHVPPLSPFVIRVKGEIGKFEAQSGKLNFTPQFYQKFGPAFVGKPYFLGHKGFDSADYREKIGQILHFEYPEGGDPRWYINVSEGQTAIRTQILEEQALGTSEERTGASSIEGWSSKTEDRDGDGFEEPTEFKAGGIAMVRRGAAGGTQIDQVIR